MVSIHTSFFPHPYIPTNCKYNYNLDYYVSGSCGFLTGGHFGRDKTYKKIASRFYWPEMAGEVREFIAAFDVCQKINDGGKLTKATAPLHPIQVDGGWYICTLMHM